MFNPYTAGAGSQVTTYSSAKQDNKMSGQKIKENGADRNMAKGGQDHSVCYEAPKT